ncbi:MAG TPA: aspartyl/asparaginyl beta-hydroxylase domain-containing protein [Steroidobacteraceae bacterium]|nr:aspartyl/asparaginyl beta-hydroxylase domain-containing protein [Gammaproteobacteria bacterium]HEV2284782.1 aspartyl/asparaginyl beta-hydroxylase domain-containing protein [Steroidobacteraceae bacterium]
MSDVNAAAGGAATDNATVLRMIQASKAALAAGRTFEADQLLARVAQLAPAHPAVLNELGLQMLNRGEAAKASELFRRATQADPQHPNLWSNLASSLHALNRLPEELDALERALALEPRHLASLLQKGALMEATGDARNAARVYRNALATLPPGATPPETVAPVIEHARAAVARDEAALAAAIEERLGGIRASHGGGPFRRVDHCIELLTGSRARYLPQPTFMYFPQIPAVEFFERAEFPWLDALEAASEEIRTELMSVLVADREGLEPYIAYPEGVPLKQWKELNKSRRWSAYFLWNQSQPQAAHLARCPRTAELLRSAPQVDVARRGPTAFFSILDAHTHIPPHTGVTNTRLTVHLPLVVPPGCRFRVGSETREWVAGKAWVFDDTIEHEAWNDSDVPRGVLIFDIWNPFLSAAERDLIRAATEAVGTYYGAGLTEAL